MNDSQPSRLWHGGAPGRRVGDLLLPPARTGLAYTRRQQSVDAGLPDVAQRLDRVYVTTDRHLAYVYASMWSIDGARQGGGSLYLVQCDELEPDDDLLSLPGVSFQTSTARVKAVSKVRVALDRARCARKLSEVLSNHNRAKGAST